MTAVNMEDLVKCSLCGWQGKRQDCAFGHDDLYCPSCLKEGGIDSLQERILQAADQIYQEIIAWEMGLKVGVEAIARWTNCGNFYQTVVRVRKINELSFGVEIIAPLAGYPAGCSLNIPRVLNAMRWSFNNRLEPKGG